MKFSATTFCAASDEKRMGWPLWSVSEKSGTACPRASGVTDVPAAFFSSASRRAVSGSCSADWYFRTRIAVA
jgi:hypothetical protein